MPVWTLLAIAGAVAAARMLPMPAGRGQLLVAAVAVLAAAAACAALLDGARAFRASPTVPMCLVAAVGTAVDGYADRLDIAIRVAVPGRACGRGLTPDS